MFKFKWRFPKKTNLYCVLFGEEHRKTKWTCTNMLGTSLEWSVPRHGLTYRGDEQRTTQDNEVSFPFKVKVVERSFYMDDSFKSVPSLLEVCSLQAGLVNLLSLEGFRLTKGISNDKDLLNAIPAGLQAQSVRIVGKEDTLLTKRALTVIWDVSRSSQRSWLILDGKSSVSQHQYLTQLAFSFIHCPGKYIFSVAVEPSSRLGREDSGRNPARMVSCFAEGTGESSGILSTTVLSPCYGFSHLTSIQLHLFGYTSEKAFSCCLLSI